MPRAQAIVFGLLFTLLAGALCFWGAHVFPAADGVVVFAIAGGCAALAGGWIAFGDVLSSRGRVTVVASPAPPSSTVPTSAYRGAMPAPRVRTSSARTPALVVLGCALAASALVPLTLDLPRWLEIECVLASWWLVWAVVLAVVAARGAPVRDDHGLVVALPWGRAVAVGVRAKTPPPRRRSRIFSVLGDVLGAASDLEAILVALVVVLVLGLAFVGAWLVIEVAAPVLFFVAYLGVVRALRTPPRGGARAVLTGIGWATAYVAPMAFLVAALHLVV